MEDLRLNEAPLSERARHQIQKYIQQMDLNSSNKLPREETLAKIIGVSRITIRKALDDLASEGIIYRKHGKGTFVNVDSLNIKVKLNPAMEFTQMIKDCGFSPSVKLLDIKMVPWDEKIGDALQAEEQKQMVMTEKIFLADEKICAYCVDYFLLDLIGGIEAFDSFAKYEKSVFQYIYSLSEEKIEWDKIEIDTIVGKDIPNLKKHNLLPDFANKPYLKLTGINYNSENVPLIYAEEYIDTSLIKFSMIRQRIIRY